MSKLVEISERGFTEAPDPAQRRITRVTLAVAAHRLEAVARFYLDELGLSGTRDPQELRLAVGRAHLSFAAPSDGEPFYHFALLLPGNRFDAAREWLGACAPLLAQPGSARTTFDFDFWDASACYVLDPAGNILELIAHRGLEDSPEVGEFHPAELRGISEIGLVTGDLLVALERLRAGGLELWYGDVSQRGGLGFVGRKAHTLILSPTGRPWLPTGRPAESHPLEVAVGTPGHPEIVVRVRDGSVEVAAPQNR